MDAEVVCRLVPTVKACPNPQETCTRSSKARSGKFPVVVIAALSVKPLFKILGMILRIDFLLARILIGFRRLERLCNESRHVRIQSERARRQIVLN